VVASMNTASRKPYGHTKTRAEVRGGGKKPWQQKGTGRARHGSTRSPIWVKGGVAHGPRNDKNFDRKVNKKMKIKALNTILSAKLKDNEIVFVDAINLTEAKTKHAAEIIKTLGGNQAFNKLATKRTNAAIIAMSKKDVAAERAFRNIGKVVVTESRNLSPVDLLNYKYVIFVNPQECVKMLSDKLTK
jgi:large subunit ribosomal protein L4